MHTWALAITKIAYFIHIEPKTVELKFIIKFLNKLSPICPSFLIEKIREVYQARPNSPFHRKIQTIRNKQFFSCSLYIIIIGHVHSHAYIQKRDYFFLWAPDEPAQLIYRVLRCVDLEKLVIFHIVQVKKYWIKRYIILCIVNK